MKTFAEYIKSLFDLENREVIKGMKNSPHGLILAVFFSNSGSDLVKVLEAQNDYMLVEDKNGSVFAIPYASAIGKVTNATHSKAHEWKGKS